MLKECNDWILFNITYEVATNTVITSKYLVLPSNTVFVLFILIFNIW